MQNVNPSLKNGYLSIAIELVDQFARCNIPGNQMRIMWIVMRKTWGWTISKERKKDWDRIPLTQFEKLTEMNRRNVSRSLKQLVAKRLLLKGEKGYKINQNYNEWIVAKRLQVGVNMVTGRGKYGKKVVAKRLHSIDIIKDTIQKKEDITNWKDTPIHLQTDSFKIIWAAWLEVRKKMRVPNTKKSLELALNKLEKHPVEIAIKMVEQSVERGWRGIFDLNTKNKGGIKEWLRTNKLQKD